MCIVVIIQATVTLYKMEVFLWSVCLLVEVYVRVIMEKVDIYFFHGVIKIVYKLDKGPFVT